MKVIKCVLLSVGAMAVSLFIANDIRLYLDGGRPRLAVVDDLCGIILHPKRNWVVAKVPVREEGAEFTVSHRWRGNYQFRLWVPEEMNEEEAVRDRLGIHCRFFDGNGSEVFAYGAWLSAHSSWTQRRWEMPYGKELSFRMYRAPDDVPLDENLKLTVKFGGDIQKFILAHPNSLLLVVKERDK